ncbi:MAG: hypothetical protein AAFZ07_12100 [Actinomycetota bacterium]
MFGPITRFGAISAARRAVPRPSRPHLVAAVGGGVLLALGVRGILAADLGVAPMDVFLVAVSERSGVGIGVVALGLQVVLLSIATALGRPPRTSTWIFAVSSGVTLELTAGLLGSAGGWLTGAALWTAGFALMVIAIAVLVVGTDAGGSFELLSLAAADRGLPAVPVRTALELGFVALGVALGGPLGVGTAAFALGVGPAVDGACRLLVRVVTDRERRRVAAS